MPIRIACPRCSAALTISDRAAGRVAKCPKCLGQMAVPELPAEVVEASEPVFDEIEIVEPTPPPRPKKQVRVERHDDDDDDRPRRQRKRLKSKKASGLSPAWIVAISIGGVLLLGGIATGVWFATKKSDSKPVVKTDLLDTPSTDTKEPVEPKTEIVQYGPLPAGWSYNTPDLGFKAAWPVDKGSDGFTPKESLTVGYSGTKPNGWSMPLGPGEESGILFVGRIDLPDSGIDDERTLDNYSTKMKNKSPSGLKVTKIQIHGKSAREFQYELDGQTIIQRATIVGDTLWTVQANAKSGGGNQETITRFLESFRAF